MKKSIGYIEYQPFLDCLVSLIKETWGDHVISVVLYGSVSRGEAQPTSDVDLLLILKEAPPVYWKRLQPLISVLHQLRKQPCWKDLEAQGISPSPSLLVLSQEEARQNRLIFLDMIEEARMLMDQDGFFQDRLDALRMRLQELGAKKVRRNGTWYWDLKPDLKPGEVVTL